VRELKMQCGEALKESRADRACEANLFLNRNRVEKVFPGSYSLIIPAENTKHYRNLNVARKLN